MVIAYSFHRLGSFILGMIVLPALSNSQDYECSRATYYGSPDCLGNPTGACGYGDYGTTVNGGNVAAVSRLYKNGAACGACYQVKCTGPACTDAGVQVVATDYGSGGHGSDFILTPAAYARMARPGRERELLGYGVVDIQFRRIPCRFYGDTNLKFKIHGGSKYPHYLALLILYQGGYYDVPCVQIWQEDCKQWRDMRRPFGAVWDMENPPRGALTVRFQLVSEVESKWIQLVGVISDFWKPGDAYDSGIQITT